LVFSISNVALSQLFQANETALMFAPTHLIRDSFTLNATLSMTNSEALFVSPPIDASVVKSITGLVVGVVVGSVVVLLCICLLIVLIKRRKSPRRQATSFTLVDDDNDKMTRSGIITQTLMDFNDVMVGKTSAVFNYQHETDNCNRQSLVL
jgi:hypothetical protein